MPDLATLLAKGYFPEELPPPFITNIYARAIIVNFHGIPKSFSSRNLIAKTASHSVARVDILRRSIGIPNPILFYDLCQDIIVNWGTIASHYAHSSISASIPVTDTTQRRALWWSKDFRHHIPLRARVRAANKWILKTDISKFYPSIYSHSIPWALHGKPFSKTNRSVKYLGNLLDQWIRNGQDGQTIGIPIGPDTSLVIAEIILSAIDFELQKRIPQVNCLRVVDDYEFGCISYSQAEETLAILQEVLKEYELDINFDKTKIMELPIPFDPSWISELRRYEIRKTPTTQRNDLIQYFSRAFELSNQNPRDSILKYTINRLRNTLILNSENWNLLQNFLLQTTMAEPGVIQPVLELLIDHNKNKFPINLSLVKEVLNHTIATACPLGYANETAWSLWGLIYWGLSIEKQASDAIAKTTDTVIALLALDANRRGLIPSGLDLKLWETYMTKIDLYGKQWLLSYEANIKGWLPSFRTSNDHVSSDTNFGFLKTNGVYFYDETKFKSAKIGRFFPSEALRQSSITLLESMG